MDYTTIWIAVMILIQTSVVQVSTASAAGVLREDAVSEGADDYVAQATGLAGIFLTSPSTNFVNGVPQQPQPYSFAFQSNDRTGGSMSRQERGDGSGAVSGSYGYVDPAGVYRQVDYVADGNGYRAMIRTNEPGTQSASPANVQVLSNAVQVAPGAAAAGTNGQNGNNGFSGQNFNGFTGQNGNNGFTNGQNFNGFPGQNGNGFNGQNFNAFQNGQNTGTNQFSQAATFQQFGTAQLATQAINNAVPNGLPFLRVQAFVPGGVSYSY